MWQKEPSCPYITGMLEPPFTSAASVRTVGKLLPPSDRVQPFEGQFNFQQSWQLLGACLGCGVLDGRLQPVEGNSDESRWIGRWKKGLIAGRIAVCNEKNKGCKAEGGYASWAHPIFGSSKNTPLRIPLQSLRCSFHADPTSPHISSPGILPY